MQLSPDDVAEDDDVACETIHLSIDLLDNRRSLTEGNDENNIISNSIESLRQQRRASLDPITQVQWMKKDRNFALDYSHIQQLYDSIDQVQ